MKRFRAVVDFEISQYDRKRGQPLVRRVSHRRNVIDTEVRLVDLAESLDEVVKAFLRYRADGPQEAK